MSTYLSISLRELVVERAGRRCEYCQFPQFLCLYPHEPDHIIPVQHGGANHEGNLALACLRCNRYKGPNIGSFDPTTGLLVPFFNPRVQKWEDHFAWNGARIQPHTAEARVTLRILRLNDPDRIAERDRLMQCGLFTPL